MHEMGFTKHECCTSIHFSGMISIRLETCKPFSSSKPQMQYSRVHSTHTHTWKNQHIDHRLQTATTETQTMPADLMPYIYLFGRVLCKYANIDHFVSQSGQGACKINAERDRENIESTCFGMLWSCLMKKNTDCFSWLVESSAQFHYVSGRNW